jgi:hypothetical protein
MLGLTSAGHVYDHVDVDVHAGRVFSVDAELVVGPTPDIFADVIENEEEGQESDEECEESARVGPGLVGGGQLWERIETCKVFWNDTLELVDNRLWLGLGCHGSWRSREVRRRKGNERTTWNLGGCARFHHHPVSTTTMSEKKSECLQSHALNVPWVQILKGKRVVLASASPRRREILAIFVRPHLSTTSTPLTRPTGVEPRDRPLNL